MNTDAETRSAKTDGDAGLACLELILGLLKLPVEADVLRRSVGQHGRFKVGDIVRGAGLCGAGARLHKTDPARLERLPVPFIACFGEGRFEVVAGVKDGKVLLQKPGEQEPAVEPLEAFAGRWSGEAVLFKAGKGGDDRERRFDLKGFGLNWVVPEMLRHKGAFANVLMASLLVQVFALVTPLFTMIVIDKVLSNSSYSTLDVLAMGLIAIAVFDFTIGGLRSHLLGDLTNRMDAKLAAGLFEHLLRLPLTFFNSRRTGDMVSRVREMEAVRNFFTGPSLTAVIDFPFTIVFLAVMFWFSPALTFLVIGAVAALLLLYGVVGGVLRGHIRRKSDVQADNQSFLVEGVSSIETFKSLAVEPQIQRQWEEHVVANNKAARRAEQLNQGLSQAAGFINKLTIALGLWFGAKAVLAGSMTPGQLIAFNMMISRVLAPAMRIAQLFQHIQQTRVSLQRMGDIFEARTESGRASPVTDLPAVRGRVVFENVSFAYAPDAPNVLEEIDFDVQPGEVVGIVGVSGAGKSTLMRLLQRLYLPQKGRILVDGVNIANADPAWLRRQIGAVPQENLLLHRTIRENINIANPGMSMDQVESAAKLAGADEFIRALPEAYNTVVGERGARLSMGQRQRIALARALATDPRLLILDEATSSLDQEAEQRVQQNMQRITRGRTVFIIAHRLSTLMAADRIMVLKNGRIAETGSLKSLLGGDGEFARLYRAQIASLQRRRVESAQERPLNPTAYDSAAS